jgi:hypothetical protein
MIYSIAAPTEYRLHGIPLHATFSSQATFVMLLMKSQIGHDFAVRTIFTYEIYVKVNKEKFS